MQPAFQIRPPMQQKLGTSSEVLTQLFAADVNLVVWQRSLDADVLQYAQFLANTPLQLQQVMSLEQLSEWLQRKLPDATGKAAFVDDLLLISQMLGCLMDCSAVGVRLKTLSKPMCPKFHTDHVASRLLVTYTGAATEWLSAAPAVGSNPPAHQLQPGDVAVLKGSGWIDNEHGAIWHRSPLSLVPRLLLTLDPVGD